MLYNTLSASRGFLIVFNLVFIDLITVIWLAWLVTPLDHTYGFDNLGSLSLYHCHQSHHL
jgi:hypothetical protein